MLDVNKIYQGDSAIILKEIADSSIDMILTSPPYDNLRQYNGYTFNFEEIAKELYRILKPNCVCVWVIGDATVNGSESGTSFKQALYFKSIGFNLHDTMIYEKNSSTFPAKKNSNRYTQIFEYMFVFSKEDARANLICDKANREAGKKYGIRNTFGGKDYTVPEFSPRTNIWKYTTSLKSSKMHPAMFPIELARDHILSWTNENDIVLDPFAGAGTTLVAARLLNRKYIGIDISEAYIKVANNRMQKEEHTQC